MLKRALIKVDMKRIDMYSARNIITKDTELNSVLKPLTNSDSPSEKSKGDRFVSARLESASKDIETKRKQLKFELLFCMIS